MDGRGHGRDRAARSHAGRGSECGDAERSHRGSDPGGMSGARGMPREGRVHVRRPMSEAPRSVARGGIRFAILGLLKEKPRHGYDIIRAMEDLSGGLYSPSPGAVYPTLQSLEDQDLVTSSTEDGKKVYAITEAGISYLQEHKSKADSHRERWEANWGAGQTGEAAEALQGIHDAFHAVRKAIRESAGDAEKIKEIDDVLQDAAAKIGEIAAR